MVKQHLILSLGVVLCATQVFVAPAHGACPAGTIEDCNGNCGPENWIGDNSCDDGSFSFDGVPIFFNCAQFNNDAGDCGGGGGCPVAGTIEDCNGNCGPENWIGDNSCDDGSFSFNGVPIFFNCAQFNNDAGDCGGG